MCDIEPGDGYIEEGFIKHKSNIWKIFVVLKKEKGDMVARKSFLLMLIVATALTSIMVIPAKAGTQPSPFITLRNTTHTLSTVNPFYKTTMNGTFIVAQGRDGQWLWFEFHGNIVAPTGGLIDSYPIRLQHEIVEGYDLIFNFQAEMTDEEGVPVGNAYAFPEGETPPEREPPGGLIGTYPLAETPTPIIMYAYASSPTEVGNGTVVLTYPLPVGGIWVPVDKFGLLAPYIGVASTILVATVATAIYAKHVKHRKEKQ